MSLAVVALLFLAHQTSYTTLHAVKSGFIGAFFAPWKIGQCRIVALFADSNENQTALVTARPIIVYSAMDVITVVSVGHRYCVKFSF